MSIRIDRTIAVRTGPFQKNLDLLILETAETYLKTVMRNQFIRLFSVNYREVKSIKPNYRMFHLVEGFNQRDK